MESMYITCLSLAWLTWMLFLYSWIWIKENWKPYVSPQPRPVSPSHGKHQCPKISKWVIVCINIKLVSISEYLHWDKLAHLYFSLIYCFYFFPEWRNSPFMTPQGASQVRHQARLGRSFPQVWIPHENPSVSLCKLRQKDFER